MAMSRQHNLPRTSISADSISADSRPADSISADSRPADSGVPSPISVFGSLRHRSRRPFPRCLGAMVAAVAVAFCCLPVWAQGPVGPRAVIHKKGAGLALQVAGVERLKIRGASGRNLSRVTIKVSPSVAKDLAAAYALGGAETHISRKAKLSLGARPATTAAKHRELRAAAWFSRALKRHDAFFWRHGNRVSMYAKAIAQEMGLPQEDVRKVAISARLHDIGKLGISQTILTGTRPRLTPSSFAKIVRHPEIAAALLEPVPSLRPYIAVIRAHHENVDGTGYPRGRKGGQISLLGRIMAVADSFDAMTTNRTYSRAMTKDAAVARLVELVGSKYDAQVVAAFQRALQGNSFAKEALRRGQKENQAQGAR